MEKPSLGILGLGSRTTAFYVSELNKLYNQLHGGYNTYPFILLNTNFDTINTLLPSPSSKLDTVVQRHITEIEKQDIEQIIVPNITLHETIDRLSVSKKIIHPVIETISALKKQKQTKVVLFGSAYSMESDYLQGIFFNKNDIEIILPSEKDRIVIDEVRKQVYQETETKALLDEYISLLSKYSQKQVVVIACTELSIVSPDSKNIVDMAKIQLKNTEI